MTSELARGRAGQTVAPSALAVFDGSCEFCRRCAAFVRHRAPPDELRLVPFDSEEGEAAIAALGLDGSECDSLVVVAGDRYWTRSEAVVAIGRRLPRIRTAARLFALVPRRLRDTGYDWLARHRHRVCGNGACMASRGPVPRPHP